MNKTKHIKSNQIHEINEQTNTHHMLMVNTRNQEKPGHFYNLCKRTT